MVTGDGGYPLLAQINIHEWKQWLRGMGGYPCRNNLVVTRDGSIPAEVMQSEANPPL